MNGVGPQTAAKTAARTAIWARNRGLAAVRGLTVVDRKGRSERSTSWDIQRCGDGSQGWDIQGCAPMSTNGSRAKTVGERIRARRLQCGISQEALGARIGVKQKVISDWERGEHEPELPNLEKLAEALGCHWTDFYRVADEAAA